MRIFKKIDIDFDAIETYVGNHLRFFISAAISLMIFIALISLMAFMLTIRGAEQTMVPNVKGKELTQALLELQAKELYPKIQLRYSNNVADKGTILEQDPGPGTIVKAGRRIHLVVSRGMVIDKVENYIGQQLDDVKIHLQTLVSASGRPLLSLREPPLYAYSSQPVGTILEQKPEPGTDIDGPVRLEFVVSRGPENAMIKVPDLIGLPLQDAFERIRQSGVAFVFSMRQVQNRETPGTVVSQLPAGQTVMAANTRLNLVVAAPAKVPEGEVFGLFAKTLPEYPYPLEVRLDALLPNGERRRIITVNHPGGDFTVPYQLPKGTVMILSVLNREIIREEIQ
ncbi:MAG: PASTA domain-containing protein [Termitinemataceae bacterium]